MYYGKEQISAAFRTSREEAVPINGIRRSLGDAQEIFRRMDEAIKDKTENIGLKGILLSLALGGFVGASTIVLNSFDGYRPAISTVSTQATTYHASFGDLRDIAGYKSSVITQNH